MSQIEVLVKTADILKKGIGELEKELGNIDNREFWQVPVLYHQKKGRSLKVSKIETPGVDVKVYETHQPLRQFWNSYEQVWVSLSEEGRIELNRLARGFNNLVQNDPEVVVAELPSFVKKVDEILNKQGLKDGEKIPSLTIHQAKQFLNSVQASIPLIEQHPALTSGIEGYKSTVADLRDKITSLNERIRKVSGENKIISEKNTDFQNQIKNLKIESEKLSLGLTKAKEQIGELNKYEILYENTALNNLYFIHATRFNILQTPDIIEKYRSIRKQRPDVIDFDVPDVIKFLIYTAPRPVADYFRTFREILGTTFIFGQKNGWVPKNMDYVDLAHYLLCDKSVVFRPKGSEKSNIEEISQSVNTTPAELENVLYHFGKIGFGMIYSDKRVFKLRKGLGYYERMDQIAEIRDKFEETKNKLGQIRENVSKTEELMSQGKTKIPYLNFCGNVVRVYECDDCIGFVTATLTDDFRCQRGERVPNDRIVYPANFAPINNRVLEEEVRYIIWNLNIYESFFQMFQGKNPVTKNQKTSEIEVHR